MKRVDRACFDAYAGPRQELRTQCDPGALSLK